MYLWNTDAPFALFNNMIKFILYLDIYYLLSCTVADTPLIQNWYFMMNMLTKIYKLQ